MTVYNNTFAKFNQNFFGSITLSILAQSCLGGIAAMSVLANGTSLTQMIQLAIIVFICILTNTSILAQMTAKFIFNIIAISMASSIFLS